jgi:hypothetical protein
MSAHIERLPTQHKLHPHCPACKKDLPTFDHVCMTMNPNELRGGTLLGVTYHVQCSCGNRCDLRKNARM